jgi:hypothetical protein
MQRPGHAHYRRRPAPGAACALVRERRDLAPSALQRRHHARLDELAAPEGRP